MKSIIKSKILSKNDNNSKNLSPLVKSHLSRAFYTKIENNDGFMMLFRGTLVQSYIYLTLKRSNLLTAKNVFFYDMDMKRLGLNYLAIDTVLFLLS